MLLQQENIFRANHPTYHDKVWRGFRATRLILAKYLNRGFVGIGVLFFIIAWLFLKRQMMQI